MGQRYRKKLGVSRLRMDFCYSGSFDFDASKRELAEALEPAHGIFTAPDYRVSQDLADAAQELSRLPIHIEFHRSPLGQLLELLAQLPELVSKRCVIDGFAEMLVAEAA